MRAITVVLLAATSLACTPSAAELLAQRQMNEQACSRLHEVARLKQERLDYERRKFELTHTVEENRRVQPLWEKLTEEEELELVAPGSCSWRPYK